MSQILDTNVADLVKLLDEALPPSVRGNRRGFISKQIRFVANDNSVHTLPVKAETVWYTENSARKAQRAVKIATWFLPNKGVQITAWSDGKVTERTLDGLRSQHTGPRPKSSSAF